MSAMTQNQAIQIALDPTGASLSPLVEERARLGQPLASATSGEYRDLNHANDRVSDLDAAISLGHTHTAGGEDRQ